MRKSRLIQIPDKLFHKIWEISSKNREMTQEELIKHINAGKTIDYKKYGLDYVKFCYLIVKIKKYEEFSFKEIMEMAGKRKIDISDIFCVPIRTVEEWYTGNNKCPAYMRLIMLKQFHLLHLDKYMKLKSEIEYKESKPKIYDKRENISEKIVKTSEGKQFEDKGLQEKVEIYDYSYDKLEKLEKLENAKNRDIIDENISENIKENKKESKKEKINDGIDRTLEKNIDNEKHNTPAIDVNYSERKVGIISEYEEYKEYKEYEEYEEYDADYDEYEKKRREFFMKYGFFPDVQVKSSSSITRSILERTDYLKLKNKTQKD